ncbi:MAG: sulfatase [Planctomycetota bacterium]
MEEPEPEPESRGVVLDVFPLGLLIGGAAAIARGALANGSGYERLALAEAWPEVLTEALVAGVVSALALQAARTAKRSGAFLLAFLVTALVLAVYLSGFPRVAGDAVVPAVVAAFALAIVGTALSLAPIRGPVALGLALALGVGLPAFLASRVRGESDGMPIRQVVVDVVASPHLLTTVRARDDAPPGPGVLTPAVDQTTDTGDKPSLVLPPPAAQEFVVPGAASGIRLTAAAGADLSVIETLPAALTEVRVEYRIVVDGEVAWSETIAHRRMPQGTFDTSNFQWRHVATDGEKGVPVRSGQTVRLETSFAEGQDVDGLEGANLRLGFGGVALERTLRQERRVATADAPNVVFVVMDTLRRDRTGVYGYERNTTPRLDAFAADGLVFEDAYATSSWTWPSTASLLTGRLPDAHGVKSSSSCTLAQRLPTIAEALQARGYTTAAFVGNPIIEPNRWFDQGFETFEVEVPHFRMSDEVVPHALEWLREHASLRFFLYLQLVDPHTPHRPHPEEAERLGLPSAPSDWPERGLNGVLQREPPSEAVAKYANQLYDASVATGDRWFGAVLDELESLGLTKRTIVVFTSDHGEELFERGRHGHGHGIHAELVRAPLVMRGPGVPRGRRDGVVSNRHVPTTLAALVGARLETPDPPVHLIDDTLPDQVLFETTKGVWGAARYQQLLGLRSGPGVTHWRESDQPTAEIPASDLRRYDVLADPSQVNDLSGLDLDAARADVARIRERIEVARDARPPLVLGVGAQGQSVLEGIGYAGGDEDEPR